MGDSGLVRHISPEMMEGNMSTTCSTLQPQAQQRARSRPAGVTSCAFAETMNPDMEGMALQGSAHLLSTRYVDEEHCCNVRSTRNKLPNRAFTSD